MEYQVMPDIREKEKIVGGIFTATQTIFLALAVVAGGGLAVLTYTATSSVPLALLVLVLGAAPFLPFAFIKIEKMGDMELIFYLWIRFKYMQGQKIFLNLNENQRNRLIGEYNGKEKEN